MTKFLLRYFGILSSCCILSSVALATPIFDITVIPSIGPSYYSPSYIGYANNAEYAIQNGLSSYGDPAQPTYYFASSGPLIDLGTVVETTFPSWLGSTTLPSANYASEVGNDLYFGLRATANTSTTFDLADVNFETFYLGYIVANYSSINPDVLVSRLSSFSPNIVGYAGGATYYSSSFPGASTTPIIALYTSGYGVSEALPSGWTLPDFVALIRSYGSTLDPAVAAQYTIQGDSGTVNLDQSSVPESATFPLLVLGCGAIAFGRKFLVRRLG